MVLRAEQHHVLGSEVVLLFPRNDVVVLVHVKPTDAAAEAGLLAQLPFDGIRNVGARQKRDSPARFSRTALPSRKRTVS